MVIPPLGERLFLIFDIIVGESSKNKPQSNWYDAFIFSQIVLRIPFDSFLLKIVEMIADENEGIKRSPIHFSTRAFFFAAGWIIVKMCISCSLDSLTHGANIHLSSSVLIFYSDNS